MALLFFAAVHVLLNLTIRLQHGHLFFINRSFGGALGHLAQYEWVCDTYLVYLGHKLHKPLHGLVTGKLS